jgi:hypothetical protein
MKSREIGENCIMRNLYPSPSIFKMIKSMRMRWAGHVARMGPKKNAYRMLVGKPEEKRPLHRARHSWTILKWISDSMGWHRLD